MSTAFSSAASATLAESDYAARRRLGAGVQARGLQRKPFHATRHGFAAQRVVRGKIKVIIQHIPAPRPGKK